jgi:hypothetical protein
VKSGGRRGAALLLAATTVVSAHPASAQADTVSSIRSAQTEIVQRNFQSSIGQAELQVSQAEAAAAADSRALTQAQAAASNAGAILSQAKAKLGSDTQALHVATAVRAADHRQVEKSRAGLSIIAVGLYTGEATSLQPGSLHALETGQQAVIEAGEVQAVESVLDRALKAETAAASAADRRWKQLTRSVADDGRGVQSAGSTAEALNGRVRVTAAAEAGDQQRLASAGQRLAAAQGALRAALAAVAGPTGTGLSVLGGSALSPSQLVNWYNSQGYVDFTSASIRQLATWYVQAGQTEGVRGDVAFAQAILETGGFSSPDAVYLSNFAGIGHCDSCAAGWDFPSPQAGVVGQLQLLRIWAGGGGSPAPVLAAITPSNQPLSGCCTTWESLTGVWATDPYYASQILGIYQGMLDQALAG